jgi:hypothetical protein
MKFPAYSIKLIQPASYLQYEQETCFLNKKSHENTVQYTIYTANTCKRLSKISYMPCTPNKTAVMDKDEGLPKVYYRIDVHKMIA